MALGPRRGRSEYNGRVRGGAYRWIACAVACASGMLAPAQTGDARATGAEIIKIAHSAPDDSPWGVGMAGVASHWRKTLVGREVKLYPGATAGDEARMLTLCKRGSLHAIGVADFFAGQEVPEFNVAGYPFLFDNDAEAHHVVDTVLLPRLQAIVAEHDLELYALGELGWLQLASVAPASGRDLAGLRVRIPENPFHAAVVSALGGTPVKTSMLDAAESLEQGRANAILHTSVFLFATGWYGKVRHVYETRLLYSTAFVLVNRRFWRGLPAPVRQKLVPGGAEIVRVSRTQVPALSSVVRESLVQNGVQMHALGAAEERALRARVEAGRPAIEAALGPRGRAILVEARRALARLRSGRP